MSFETISDGIEIAQGDCLEILSLMPDGSVDMILNDPPYGIAYKTGRRQDKGHRFASTIKNDEDLSLLEAMTPEFYRVLKSDSACMVFCSWNRQDEASRILRGGGFAVKNRIIWDKGTTTAGDLEGAYGYQYEVIVFASKGRPIIKGKRHSDLWRYPRVSADKLHHQNEKPVFLLEKPIYSFTEPGDNVLDPTMGSGSTGIACLNTGRRFLGVELDEGYYQVAKDRLERESAQGRLAL